MDGADVGHYNRTRIRRAKRLVADFFSDLDALAKEAPNEAELVRMDTIFPALQVGHDSTHVQYIVHRHARTRALACRVAQLSLASCKDVSQLFRTHVSGGYIFLRKL